MEISLLEEYKIKEAELKKKLESFKSVSGNDLLKEFMFCLLTPQSNAQKCWEAVEKIFELNELNEFSVREILKTKTRFHNTKTKRILMAKEMYNSILRDLDNLDRIYLRNLIAEKVNGYGLKEAGHFLRNIGRSDNQIAILDRHILRNLKSAGVIEDEKLKGRKDYLEIESKFLGYASSQGLKPDELDLIWWSRENGEIFK